MNNDGNGNLSGYAWGANVGWINFNPTHSQVTIDPATGSFDGYAWGENIGWIHFKNISPAYNVVVNFPTAEAGSDTTICSGDSVQIGGSPTASGGTPPYTYLWTPGAGLSSDTAANPQACPDTTTTYTLTVTDDNGCQDSDSVTVTVNTSTAAADFSGTPTAGCAPLTVDFADSSTGEVLSYLWNFGDGTPDTTVRNPSHIYNDPGTYTVSLTVTDTCGSDTETKIGYITVNTSSTAAADFFATTTVGCAPLEVTFADSSTGDVLSWLWNFGDGNTDTAPNPTHTYTVSDTYTVSLTVSGTCGSDTETKTGYITVFGSTVEANFDCTQTSGCAPLTVDFADSSTGDVLSWLWNFGDGDTGTDSNPQHTYTDSGTYAVSLTVSGTCGSDIETKIGYITVFGSTVEANFDCTQTSGCAPLTVHLISNCTGLPTNYNWDFGDNDTSTQQNPTHTYNNPGTYTVSLTVSGACGSDTETKIGYITVNGFSTVSAGPDDSICSGSCTTLHGYASVDSPSYTFAWTYPGGSIANDSNPEVCPTTTTIYTLTVTDNYGCQDSDSVKVTVYPSEVTAAFQADFKNTYLPLTVCFTDISTGIVTHRVWDFGDGEPPSGEANPCHTYTEAGTYEVKLIVVGPCDGDFVKMTFEVKERVEVDWTADPLNGCAPLTVQFEDASSGTVISRTWDFGDGDTSTEDTPTHIYNDPGTYSVSLFVSGENNSDSKTASVVVISSVYAGFTANPVSGLAPLEVAFSDSSTGNIQTWQWDFGDGETSSDSSPSHLYSDPGTYRVRLTVNGECGVDTREVLIEVLIKIAPVTVRWQTFNYPNPFNPVDGKEVTAPDGTSTDGTIITYTLPEDTDDEVLVRIYTIAGELVKEFKLSQAEYRSMGEHYLAWDGRNGRGKMVASGVYLYHIKAGRHTKIHKMAVIK